MDTHAIKKTEVKIMMQFMARLLAMVIGIYLMVGLAFLFAARDEIKRTGKLSWPKVPCKESLLTPPCPRQ
jgi:hypothetical protein